MKKYQIIYADPPWEQNININSPTGGKKTTDHYPLMKNRDIASLSIRDISEEDALVFLWTTYSSLLDAVNLVMPSWGFHYITVAFEWLKTTVNGHHPEFMGGWLVGGAVELCLLGKRGHPKRSSPKVHRLVVSPRREHSRKPDEVRERIVELLGDLPRIELFARQKVAGWDSIGYDINGKDIKQELEEMINA